jgi:hypothetical protein
MEQEKEIFLVFREFISSEISLYSRKEIYYENNPIEIAAHLSDKKYKTRIFRIPDMSEITEAEIAIKYKQNS